MKSDLKLTAREKEILQLLDEGLVEKEIAAKLSIDKSTVKFHINNMFSKFDVHNARTLLRRARDEGHIK